MDEPPYSNLLRTLQQHMCTVDIRMCEAVGVAEAEIYVRLSSEVHDGINFVIFHAFKDIGGVGDVAAVEDEVLVTIEAACVIQRGAIVQLVE